MNQTVNIQLEYRDGRVEVDRVVTTPRPKGQASTTENSETTDVVDYKDTNHFCVLEKITNYALRDKERTLNLTDSDIEKSTLSLTWISISWTQSNVFK